MNEMYTRLIKAIHLRDSTDEHAILRAVLEAMREPTEEIINAQIRIGVDTGQGVGYDDYVETWQAAIDEILK